jgi:hypothetical protein
MSEAADALAECHGLLLHLLRRAALTPLPGGLASLIRDLLARHGVIEGHGPEGEK